MSLSSQYKVITSPLGDGLHKDGKRLTPQRLKVLNLFENIGSGKHLSAEEVHEKLVKTSSKVSLATIYRTLSLWGVNLFPSLCNPSPRGDVMTLYWEDNDKINPWLFSIITLDESKTTYWFKMFTKVLQNIMLNVSLYINDEWSRNLFW